MARILVVEDNDPIRWILVTLLRANGYEVAQATDGQQALQLFAEQPTDLILMDLHMPVMDGLEACRRLRQKSQVPILLISSCNQPAVRERAFDCGANAFIPKPMQFDDLLARLRDLSGGSRGPAPPDGRGPRPTPGPPRRSKSRKPAISTCRSRAFSYPFQMVHSGEEFDLSPPFGYTIMYAAIDGAWGGWTTGDERRNWACVFGRGESAPCAV